MRLSRDAVLKELLRVLKASSLPSVEAIYVRHAKFIYDTRACMLTLNRSFLKSRNILLHTLTQANNLCNRLTVEREHMFFFLHERDRCILLYCRLL